MKVAGIIAEYNPFHMGHRYHIEKTRENGADFIVCVMSGNFVQRAEAAVVDKFKRAEVAVMNGADLVIELPVIFSTASAEKFALGGVYLLDMLDIVDVLSFGSESADINKLEQTAVAAAYIDFAQIREELKKGINFAEARANILKNKGVKIPNLPNDILAVEYLKAIKRTGSKMRPEAIKRKGDYHDNGRGDGFPGAEVLRKIIFSDSYSGIKKHVPDSMYNMIENSIKSGGAPGSLEYAERAILYYFRTADANILKNYYNINEGIENRIIKAASTASSLQEMYELIKTKRYTMTAVKRAVLSAFLKIEKADELPPYIRVLACGSKGRELLKAVKGKTKLPIFHNLTPDLERNPKFKKFVSAERTAGDLFSLCTPSAGKGYSEFTHKNKIIFTKDEEKRDINK